MSAKSVYLTQEILNKLPDDLVNDLRNVLDFEDCYVANLESRLRAIGEHEIADRLLEEVERLLKAGRAGE